MLTLLLIFLIIFLMPSEDTKSSKTSNTAIIALVAIFLIIALIAVLFYYQNNRNTSNSTTNSSSGTQQTTTTDSNSWETYTSANHGYSISYPKTWTKTEAAQSPDVAGLEIILLNFTDQEGRDNGKPNIMITAGGPDGFCDGIENCKDLGGKIYATYKANGDQATIDEVLKTFKLN
jgi:hypothetical protein